MAETVKGLEADIQPPPQTIPFTHKLNATGIPESRPPENEIHRPHQAQPRPQVVPAQGLPHVQHREGHEH